MTALMILGALPSVLFMVICLYAVIDAECVEKYTREAWSDERETR